MYKCMEEVFLAQIVFYSSFLIATFSSKFFKRDVRTVQNKIRNRLFKSVQAKEI